MYFTIALYRQTDAYISGMKKHLKNEQRSRDDAAKKELRNTSGVGKTNNYYEGIYIPPYNNAR